MRYMSFVLYMDRADTEIHSVEFFDTDLGITKVRDVLYAEAKIKHKQGPFADTPIGEAFAKFRRGVWKKPAVGFHQYDDGYIFVAKQGDEIWEMLVKHVDADGCVPDDVACEFVEKFEDVGS